MDFLSSVSTDETTCQCCGAQLTGRRGKKFYSDQCRAQFHNQKRNKDERWLTGMNRVLRKNRTILKKLNPVGHSTVRQM
jgi:hypothetical protein